MRAARENVPRIYLDLPYRTDTYPKRKQNPRGASTLRRCPPKESQFLTWSLRPVFSLEVSRYTKLAKLGEGLVRPLAQQLERERITEHLACHPASPAMACSDEMAARGERSAPTCGAIAASPGPLSYAICMSGGLRSFDEVKLNFESALVSLMTCLCYVVLVISC